MKNLNIFTANVYSKLRATGSSPGIFYGLPKIHNFEFSTLFLVFYNRGSNHAWLIFGLMAAMIVACFQMHKVRAKFVVSEEQEEVRVEPKVERKTGEARRRKTQKE